MNRSRRPRNSSRLSETTASAVSMPPDADVQMAAIIAETPAETIEAIALTEIAAAEIMAATETTVAAVEPHRAKHNETATCHAGGLGCNCSCFSDILHETLPDRNLFAQRQGFGRGLYL